MRNIAFAVALALAPIATPAFAQDISAGVDLKSAYMLDDAITATNKPVVQAWASVNVTEECSLDAWGSKGLGTGVGDEVDLGASCRFDITSDIKAKVSVNRYIFFRGTPDMTALEAAVSHGPVDLSVSRYIWDGGLPDATRVQLGINAKLAPKLSGRTEVTYEEGFGLRDTVVLGADLRYSVTDKLSVFATGYVPVKKSRANDNKVVVGVSINF